MEASVLFPKLFTEEALSAYLFLKCSMLSSAFWPPYFLSPLCLGHFSSCSALFHSPGCLLFSLRLLSEHYPIGENSMSSQFSSLLLWCVLRVACMSIMVLLYGGGMLLNSFPACLVCRQGWVLVWLAGYRLDHHWVLQLPALRAGVDMVSNYCLPSTTSSAKTFNDGWDMAWETKDNGGRVRTRYFHQLASFLREEWCWEGHHGARALNYDNAKNRS